MLPLASVSSASEQLTMLVLIVPVFEIEKSVVVEFAVEEAMAKSVVVAPVASPGVWILKRA
jgi:hypothetical protein